MKKVLLMILLCLNSVIAVYSQSTGVGEVLFLYEENNESITPWVMKFENYFSRKNWNVALTPASDITGVDLNDYDLIILYGAVMAFTANEPLRDWLDTSPDLSGKKVLLFVTANRWFLKKYTRQLEAALTGNNAEIIDTVSAATKKMSEQNRDTLIEESLDRIK